MKVNITSRKSQFDDQNRMQTAVRNYMFAGWRDPDNLTIKTFMDVRTVPEFWEFLANFNGQPVLPLYFNPVYRYFNRIDKYFNPCLQVF